MDVQFDNESDLAVRRSAPRATRSAGLAELLVHWKFAKDVQQAEYVLLAIIGVGLLGTVFLGAMLIRPEPELSPAQKASIERMKTMTPQGR